MPSTNTDQLSRRDRRIDNSPAYSVVRQCNQCGLEFPRTETHFYLRPTGQFMSTCRICRRVRNRTGRVTQRAAVARFANGRQFGVEIEFIGSMIRVADAMRDAGIEVSSVGDYTHRVVAGQWKIVPDGSVSRGGEIVSPILSGEEGREQLRIVCAAAQSAGARVNRSTGLHIHHDVADLARRSFARVFRFWTNNEVTGIDPFFPVTRRNAPYCRHLPNAVTDRIESLSRLDREHVSNQCSGLTRYYSLNVQSYTKYGTIEVRKHQGTLNATKILAWLDFGQALMTWAKSDDDMPVNLGAESVLDTLAAAGEMSSNSITQMRSRLRTYNRVAA